MLLQKIKYPIFVTVIMGAIFYAAWIGTRAYFIQHPTTWTIVAVDPATGDVGVAGASCVPATTSRLAALAPGKGAVASQAEFSQGARDQMFEWVKQNKSASEIIAAVANAANDPRFENRQHGVVTIVNGQTQAAAFTGKENSIWAGSFQNQNGAVTVQGNLLVSERVAQNALAAFDAQDIGPVAFSDRLMRAVEAASAAGGDARCNILGQQTAGSAFIMVARANDAPFVEPKSEYDPSLPNAPWLYLSSAEMMLVGQNPVRGLRSQYDAWRAKNLPACAACNLKALAVPSGLGLGLVQMILIVCIVPLALVGALVWWLRARRTPKNLRPNF